MSLLVEDKDVRSSKSNFSIFKNEKIKYEGKDISATQFSYRIQSGFFQAIDIEILNAVYLLKYSTSRQITQFLNSVRNIEVNQSKVTKRLSALNNTSCIGRYSFTSDERTYETGLKCYVLKERGKRLLLQREYKCNWNIFNSPLVLENIKNYLAQNNYILKLISTNNIDFSSITINENYINYKINGFEHIVITLRSSDQCQSIIKKALSQYENAYLVQGNLRLIFIGEDVMHLFQIFKDLVKLTQLKEIKSIYLNSTYFTSDLRILEDDISSCFNIFKINESQVTLEDSILNELKNNVEI